MSERRAPSQAPAGSTRQGGYTLMEVLTVLALTALVSVLLFDGLGGIYGLQSRLEARSAEQQRRTLVHDWMRESLRGLVRDYDDQPNGFVGDADGLSGLTVSPLDGIPGAPRAFGWRIVRQADSDGETRAWLAYVDADGRAERLADVAPEAAFVYLAAPDAEPVAVWSAPELPALVALAQPDYPPVAAAPARREPPPLRDIDALRAAGG